MDGWMESCFFNRGEIHKLIATSLTVRPKSESYIFFGGGGVVHSFKIKVNHKLLSK